jgi:FkbM family methyltransferase
MIQILQQSIGFGYDSGLKNEVNQFLKELNNFKIVNPIVLDVGANVGNWSKLVNSQLMSCEIHAFEPSRDTFFSLAEFAKIAPNVHIHNFACGEENTSRILYYDESMSGMASLSKRDLKHLNIDFEKFESVEIRRLDTFLTNSLIKPDGLKIDVEGHELEVLNGLGDQIHGLKVIQFEFGGTDIDSRTFFHDFWSFFETKEFDLYRLSPKGKIRVSSFQERDEVFSFTTYFAIAREN